MTRRSFTEITETLTSDEGLTIKERAQFHAFNPRGAYAAKRTADQAVSEAVSAGIMKGGALFAYGSLNDYGSESLMRLVQLKRPARHDVDYAIRWTWEAAAKAHAKISEAHAAS